MIEQQKEIEDVNINYCNNLNQSEMEMKIILRKPLWFTVIATLCLVVVTLFAVIGCDKSETPQKETLRGSKWKLVGIGSLDNIALQELEPKDCEKCYTLTFDTNNTFQTFSSTNNLQGIYKANYSTKEMQITDFGGTKMGEIGDGNLYWNHDVWHTVQTFSLQKKELRLYYNGNRNYLLFKALK